MAEINHYILVVCTGMRVVLDVILRHSNSHGRNYSECACTPKQLITILKTVHEHPSWLSSNPEDSSCTSFLT